MTVRQVIDTAQERNKTIILQGCPFCDETSQINIDFSMGSYRPEINCKCGVTLYGSCTYCSEFPEPNEAIENIHKCSRELSKNGTDTNKSVLIMKGGRL